MGLTKWVRCSSALLKVINTALLVGGTRIIVHAEPTIEFSHNFLLFLPQMSHPFDNLRIFILRKTPDYKSIIITVEQAQDQGTHLRLFFLGWMRCEEFYFIIMKCERGNFSRSPRISHEPYFQLNDNGFGEGLPISI